ncbi:Na+/H+ antiporter subunit E [Xanthobacter sp. AM11]|uniref:Na+/H+ antiporter subunit E n=1 Tax=Xanthobacter sp. AM11 TaxID=3380643 RepID=UPI0039BF5553
MGIAGGRHGVFRAMAFFAFWVVLGRTGAADLVVGALAAVAAAALSLRLLPPGATRPDLAAALRFAARFAVGSVVAAVDVARRVCVARVRVRPGRLQVPCAIADATLRQAFCAVASLQPGTLPLAGDERGLTVHCLDVTAPVAEALAADAAAFLAISQMAPARPAAGHG